MSDTITISLNSHDDDGNVVDTHEMELTREQISDIIDHAADVGLIADVLNNPLVDELHEALEVAGVI